MAKNDDSLFRFLRARCFTLEIKCSIQISWGGGGGGGVMRKNSETYAGGGWVFLELA